MLLVDLERLDLELGNYHDIRISIIFDTNEKRESALRLTLEVCRISDGLCASTRASARSISITSPITAKCNIENDIVLLEVLCDVARIASRENGIGSTPRIGVRCALVDIVGNSLASEKPDLNRLFVPNVRIDTTTVHVESMTISAVIMISNKRTSSVVTVNSLALFSNHTSDGGSDSRGKLASGTSVRSNLVESVIIDTLDGIEFTVVRPGVADGPV